MLPTVCFTVCVMAVSGTAAADPISPQCRDCLQRLASELPAVNPQEDPSYEQGLTPGSVLPALANCSLDDGEIPRLQQILKVFTDAQVGGGGAAYVREHLASLPEVSAEDRAKLVDGATKGLDTTLRHLVDYNCRILLQSHFEEGASRKWVLQIIEIGQKSRDSSDATDAHRRHLQLSPATSSALLASHSPPHLSFPLSPPCSGVSW